MNESNPSYIASVSDYRRMENNMIADIKRIREFAEKLDISEVVTRVDEVLSRVENRTFAVAVVGEFKRGKSTLINALLGQEILPADVLPTSATLNRVTYGITPSAKITFKAVDGEPEREEVIPVENLIHYVTKLTEESEAVASKIKEAVVYYPTKYCRDNADIIDTPGLNDDDAMTAITLSVMPRVDAAILVILATSPFGSFEADFLNRMLVNDLGRVVFVINRIDEIRKEEDRRRIKETITTRIQKAVSAKAAELYGQDSGDFEMFLKRIGIPKVFTLSAAQALEAKVENDPDLLTRSQFPEFEAGLEHFLTQDRGAVTLQVVADSTIAGATRVMQKINIQENALSMREEEFAVLYQSSMEKLAELEQRYQDEVQKLNQASTRALSNALATTGQLVEAIKEATVQAIDTMPISKQELNKQEELLEKLGTLVTKQAQGAAQRVAEKIQVNIQQNVGTEVERLKDLGAQINDVLYEIEMDFERIGAVRPTRNSTVEGLLAAGGLFFAIGGGMWSGYRAAGLKGAVVGGAAGAAAGLGTGFGFAYASLLILGAAPLLPLIVVMTAASFFAGDWVAKNVFAAERIERFKADVKERLLEEIDKQIPTQMGEMKLQVKQQVEDAFSSLRHYVDLEMGGAIEQMRKTLNSLREDITRSSTLKEQHLKELSTMRASTVTILEKARAKSEELRASTAV